MDSTSFASVLAGVKRMRQEYEDGESTEDSSETLVEKSGDPAAKNDGVTVNVETESPDTNVAPKASDSSNKQPKKVHKVDPQTSRSHTPPVGVGLVPNRHSEVRQVQMYSQIQVAPSQKGNPLFKSTLLKQKPITYNKEILSDYYINPTLQILFLSLKYHQLHPEYIWRRCKKLNQGSTVSNTRDGALRVLLVVVDIESPQETLRKLNNICIKQDLTLLVAWSFEQAGNYIAMFKDNELLKNKVNLSIRGVKNVDFRTNLTETLTSIRSVNKTDVINLMTEIGSFRDIVKSSNLKIHGLGDRKKQALSNTFTQPFVYNRLVEHNNLENEGDEKDTNEEV